MIEFIKDGHYYLHDGVLIPSVSDIISFKFPKTYSGVPDDVLKRKAAYGTNIHRAIEEFIENGTVPEDENTRLAVEEFERLRKEWIFSIQSVEQIVHYKDRYAGTYDLKTKDNLIIDLKTTAKLHMDMLALQIGLYYLADNNPQEKGYCMWFPKGKGAKVKEIKVLGFDECKAILKEYEEYSTR